MHTRFEGLRHQSRGWRVAIALMASMTAMCFAMLAPAWAQGGVSVIQRTAPADPAAAAAPQPQAAPSPAQEPQAQEPQAPAPADASADTPSAAAPPQTANAPQTPPNNPLGGGPWDTSMQPQAGANGAIEQGPPLSDDEALAIVQQVDDYFNNLTQLQAKFIQTNADNKQQHGVFYLERPAKVRFDYAPPSKMRIISNGEYLAIENHDLNTTDRYPLDSTPFRILLEDKVNLVDDARILSVQRGEDVIILTLEDKTGKSPGRLRLFFKTDPDFRLASWIVTDAQGLDTRIDIDEVETDVALSPDLFKFSNIGLPKFSR